ncbi:hypothetical protein [Catalinimonas niigatensis]|uniref:hypothetical protein n=1 Tax=Catalinimonas niigatensis TaxID=1397264 RepID=UPI0026662842|nr:hypothetical protein [Catalinimonas niigatensis]WPP51897.1 hypothetical protein PZB72_05785 [Catalinimonas niigatensis]
MTPEHRYQEIYLVASGDSRLAANQVGWATQEEMEYLIVNVLKKQGFKVIRAHAYDPKKNMALLIHSVWAWMFFIPFLPKHRLLLQRVSGNTAIMCCRASLPIRDLF